MNEPETPLYPAAQTIAAPGLADTDVSWLALPTSGLDTVVQVVPSQCRVRVCGPVVYPTAHTSEAERAVIPVSVPAAGLGVMVHAAPFQCAMSGPDGLLPTAHTLAGLIASADVKTAPVTCGIVTRFHAVPFQWTEYGSHMLP